MPRPNLVHLETLCWIARLGTFTAAADRLHTAQSAISARMKELERSLGVPIFQHRGARAELTVEGRQIVRRAEQLLDEADRFSGAVGEVQIAAGVIRVGLGDLSIAWFADLMVALQKDLPRVAYEIDMDLSINLRHKLELGNLDVAVITGRLEDTHLVTAPLEPTRFVWAAAPSLVARVRNKRDGAELMRTQRLWCSPRPSSFHTLAIESLRGAGANLANLNTCNRLPALTEIVVRGNGLGLLPEALIAQQLKRRTIVRVPGISPLRVELSIARRRGPDQPQVRRIMEAAVRFQKRSRTEVAE